MWRCVVGFCLFFLLINEPVNAQTYTKIEHTPAMLSHFNFEGAKFETHSANVIKTILTFFEEDSISRDLKFIAVYRPSETAIYSISARPGLAKNETGKLYKQLNALKAPPALYMNYVSQVNFDIKGGNKRANVGYTPQLYDFNAADRSAYVDAPLDEQFKNIQQWISKQAFPLFLKSAGLRNDWLNTIDLKKPTMGNATTILNSNYWKNVSNTPDEINHKIAARIFLLAYEGRFQYAKTYINIFYNSAELATWTRYLLDELMKRIQYYDQNEQHWAKNLYYTKLAGNAPKAIEECYELLEFNPNSERALANLIETQAIYQLDSSFDFNAYEQRLFKSNPMIGYVFFVWSKEDAYHQRIRENSTNLFMDPESLEADLFTFLENAIELEDYGMAGDLARLLLRHEPLTGDGKNYEDQDQVVMNYYNYALAKLGIKHDDKHYPTLKKRAVKRIDRKLEKRMKKSAVYQQFNPNLITNDSF